MKGIVTDVQRFSLHDGPGIRTTVFLKGCNMKCSWCHNPETIRSVPELLFYENNCISCLQCINVCPSGAHTLVSNKHEFIRTLCEGCGRCANVCYAEACVLSGNFTEPNAIIEQILEDIPYYRRSGGGVTVSGGEPFIQAEFIKELFAICKVHDIHTAVETNFSMPWNRMQDVLKLTDLVMLDIKHMNTEVHRIWTGLGNEQVLDNVLRLASTGIPYIVRTPIIPRVNDSEACIREISSFLCDLENLQYYELLPFNPLGEVKYRALNQYNELLNSAIPEEEQMNRLGEIAGHYGLQVKIG